MTDKCYDVCVIGGGAAGMTAAIAAAKRGFRVCICDMNKKFGKKLYATGNGRCNLANTDMENQNYHSASDDKANWLMHCMGEKPLDILFPFLHSIGIQESCVNGYYYPKSMQASSVVWAFLDALRRQHVTFYENTAITKIHAYKQGYRVEGENFCVSCRFVILACGGMAYPSLGGTTLGKALADCLKLPQEQQRPALCGVITSENTEEIKGVRVSCTAYLPEIDIADDCIQMQKGELQITEYGLSGIMIFNLSSVIGKMLQHKKEVLVRLDFFDDVSEFDFLQLAQQCPDRTITALLNAYLPDKLVVYILQNLQIDRKLHVENLTEEELKQLYYACRDVNFHVTKLKSYDAAQVTAGGICLSAVNPDTMELYGYPGIYVAGEMLDIDGNCGGYNLAFAFVSGLRAGENIPC